MVHPMIAGLPGAFDPPVVAPLIVTITCRAAGVTILEVAGELDLATGPPWTLTSLTCCASEAAGRT
jgi:hypothetical protein